MALPRKIRPTVKVLVLVLGCYYAIKFLGVYVVARGDLRETDKSLIKVQDAAVRFAESNNTHTTHNKTLGCGQVIQLAVILLDPGACREFSHLLKTVLYHRHHGIHVHMVATAISKYIMQQLIDTWELQNVEWNFIDLDALKNNYRDAGSETVLQAALPFLLPTTVRKVLFLNNKMRVLTSLENLWQHFDLFTEYQTYGLLPRETVTKSATVNVLLLRAAMIRRETDDGLRLVLKVHSDFTQIQDVLRELYGKYPYQLPCSWGVGLAKVEDGCDLDDAIMAFIWNVREERFSGNDGLELAKERVISILSSDGDLYRHQPLDCATKVTKPPIDLTLKCAEYRYAETVKRRTHLYYINPGKTSKRPKTESFDVVLLTQFTLDRFSTFERFMSNWEGPVIAVLYVTDGESLMLPNLVDTSDALKNRTNIVYHVVYKRGKFYPINYLRNVAVNQTNVPYLLFVDVDLVVNHGIYTLLKNYIQEYLINTENVVLVVAAFEALVQLDELPVNKSGLLRLMDQNKVVGYRMNRGWNLGHKPTNYPKWITTDKPYKAIWKDAYEPYVVISSKHAPVYREILLERMGDKIAYGREIYARGYDFLVLPDVFILHLPHPTSAGTNMWKQYPGYARCGAVLFNEYRDLLKREHPDKTF